MEISGIDHVGVTTGDMERAKRFYGDVLGLTLRGEGEDSWPGLGRLTGLDGARIRWAEYDLGSGQILEVLQYLTPEGRPLSQQPNDPGSAHLALATDDVHALHAHLMRSGVVVRSPAPVLIDEQGEWKGYLCLYAEDPDGFTVEFVQPPPLSAR